MSIKKNLYILFGIVFFHSLIPAYVIERLFWQARGITVQGVVACEALYTLTVIVLEVPSGMLADRFGRKTLLIIGALTSLLEFALILTAHSFRQFALAVLLTGIGRAAVSGAENAMLYDTLAALGRQDQFSKRSGASARWRVRPWCWHRSPVVCWRGATGWS